MSRKFTGKLTTDELAGAIAYAYANHEHFDGEESVADCNNNAIEFLKENRLYGALKQLTPEIEKDLKKVQFDDENCEWEKGEGFCGCEKITGFQTLPNGLTYLGVTAGGDWETPLFYIVYWDGEKLRGYIPTAGNFWDTDTKTAYGSEEDCDGITDGEKAAEENVQKRFGVSGLEQLGDMDTDAVLEDIQSRIESGTGKFVKPKGLADIDPSKTEANKTEAAKPYVKPPETMNSVKVVVVGQRAQDEMESGTFAERIADVKKEAEIFIKELDELLKVSVPEALPKAVQARDGSLQRMVRKYVMTVNLMKVLE
jgi:hypothetical protein